MPTIAQKLCSDIVNPVLDPSTGSSGYLKNLRQNHKHENSMRHIAIEKRKVFNSTTPRGKSKVIDKPKDISHKELIDKSINTIISGPLITNSNCLTNIRQRDILCKLCKYNRKINNDTKRVQTSKLFPRIDKACFQCLETETRSTQYLDTQKTNTEATNTFLKFDLNNIRTQSSKANRSFYYDNLGGKRWALTRYPVRGPDF